MADNVAITAGAGTTVAADDVGGVLHQRVKLSIGADGSAADSSAGGGVALALPVGPAYQQVTAQSAVSISNATLTTVSTITTLGYRELWYQYKNTDAADALTAFEIAVRVDPAADFVVVYNTTAHFTSPLTDTLMTGIFTDGSSLDATLLALGKNIVFRFDVGGIQAIRFRATQGGAANGTADVYATLRA